VTRKYLFDGVRVYSEHDATMVEQARFMIEGGSYYSPLTAVRGGGARYYPLYDKLGSTRRLADANQTVTDAYWYDAFGNITSQSGSTYNPYKYVGSLGYYGADYSTGLLHLGARYYNAQVGRFWTQEPARGGTNWYAYVGNNPVNRADPSGLTAWQPIIAALGLYLMGCGAAGALDALMETFSLPYYRDRDLFAHCTAACVWRRCGSVVFSWLCGHVKEQIWDRLFGASPDPRDYAANREGERCAKRVSQINKCPDCCKGVYPRP
jgi:RHS repeat-associated protein